MADSSSFYTQQKLSNASASESLEVAVVGVTYDNRQALIAKLKVGDAIILRREPTNKYDPNAIRVENENGQQIGFISRDLAQRLATSFDHSGQPVAAQVTAVVGGRLAGSSYGVRIRFTPPEKLEIKLASLEDIDL